MKRFIITVLDSLGCGALPDAAAYHSENANTLAHIATNRPLHIPHLQKMGIGNILPLQNVPPAAPAMAAQGKMASRSAGKDTTIGHWEIAGLVLEKPLPTYPNGFPDEVINAFCAATGKQVLGNCVASGTQIIQELGVQHMETGALIVYTSADSVFQIAAHEEICPVEELYRCCAIARDLLQGEHGVGRVIARPFVGNAEEGFTRTANRRDFSLQPPSGGLTESVSAAGLPVVSVGKIHDIFCGKGITVQLPGHHNDESQASLVHALKETEQGLIFANFVDFDMLYGHRNDTEGYAQAIETFDAGLAEILPLLRKDDIFVVCADHGNDPTTTKTDHDREYVPILIYGEKVRPVLLSIRSSFADLGQTAAEYLGAAPLPYGKSFLDLILREE